MWLARSIFFRIGHIAVFFTLAYLFTEIGGGVLRLEHERPVLPMIIIKGAVVTGLDLRQETETSRRVDKKTGEHFGEI